MESQNRNGEILVIEDVSRKLIVHNIDFMLTGSIAMNYYVEPRMTRDIDIVVSLQLEKIPDIVRMFEKEYYIDEYAVQLAVENNSMFNIIHNDTITKVDFIIQKKSEYRHIEFERRNLINFLQIPTYIVSKEDLIISKLDWMKKSKSDLQKKDIAHLISSGYDNTYVDNWCIALGLTQILEVIKNG